MAAPKQLVRISSTPPRCATQSGRARNGEWVLEFAAAERQQADPLMGWVGSGDTQNQVRLRFDTREQAIAYAEANGLAYDIEEPKPDRIRPKSYADNFRFGRTENWTHKPNSYRTAPPGGFTSGLCPAAHRD